MLRIISLNLNGIRSAWSKNLLPWAAAQAPDVVCLQELKAQAPDLYPAMLRPDGLHAYYHCAEKKGYSGVGLWCRRPPDRVVEGIGNAEFDAEGRYLRADFGQLSVISLYLPSGSSSPERQEAKFRFMAEFFPHLEKLRAEYQHIQTQLRQGSPRYAALTQPQPLNLAEIQQQVLDADTLLRQADYALYRAKQHGREQIEYFDEREEHWQRDRHKQRERIRKGLNRNEFVLHFQPKASCANGRITGTEALLRWAPPPMGRIDLLLTSPPTVTRPRRGSAPRAPPARTSTSPGTDRSPSSASRSPGWPRPPPRSTT